MKNLFVSSLVFFLAGGSFASAAQDVTTSSTQEATSASTPSTSTPASTTSTWPCASATPQTFALRVLTYDPYNYDGSTWSYPNLTYYNTTYLGVHSNGSQPAARPYHNKNITLWYLEDGNLQVVSETTRNPRKLAGAAVVGIVYYDPNPDPFGGFWNNWVFNVTAAQCSQNGNSCNGVSCYINTDPSANTRGWPGGPPPSPGILTCNEGSFPDTEAYYPPQDDAVVGSFDWSQEISDADTGITSATVFYEVVPSCLLPRV